MWKEIFKQSHKYQQNEQPPLFSNYWTQKMMTYDIGNSVFG
jgi:hypothetical protein